MSVDGGNEWTLFRSLVVPLSRPVLATLAIYDGLNVLEQLPRPARAHANPDHALLPLGVYKFQGSTP